jgi:hypothetical protein
LAAAIQRAGPGSKEHVEHPSPIIRLGEKPEKMEKTIQMNPMITYKNPILLSLALWSISSSGQDLRRIGTNIYDFSPLLTETQPNLYLVEGKVQSNTDGRLLIRSTSYKYYFVPEGNPLTMGSRSLLAYIAASRASPTPLSPGQVLALSPEMRQHVSRVEEYHDAWLLHYPGPAKRGGTLHAFALPVSGLNSTWDYGTPLDARDPRITNAFRVYPDHILQEHYEIPAVRLQRQLDARFAQRLAEASNGPPWHQFDVGIDYLRGYGVQTNLESALYWINKAAAGGFPEAKEFIRTNSPPKSSGDYN